MEALNRIVGPLLSALILLYGIPQTLVFCQENTSTENYAFVTKWGSQTNNALLYAGKVATDTSGNLYVIRMGIDLTPTGGKEPTNFMIQKYDPKGMPLLQFGKYSEGYGEISSPSSVAPDPSGQYVYVSESSGHVLKFKSDGTFLMEWGSQGSGDGEFSQFVEGVAVDHEGNVYVADAGNARIQKFSSEGAFLGKWGSDGSEDGQFAFPYCIAIGPDGSIYVDDMANRRIQKFTSDGQFILKWTPGDGDPQGVAVDSEGNVYVVPQSSGKVKKYTADGQFETEFYGTTLEPAYLYPPIDVAVDHDGNIYTALQNAGVQKFDKSGNHVASIFGTKDSIGGFRSPMGIAVDPDGLVYVMDNVDNRVQKFGNRGELLSQWQFAISPGTDARDLAADDQGNIYLAWEGVKIFSSDGRNIGSLKDSANEEIIDARAVAVDSHSHNIYVASNYMIQKFTLEGKLVSEWEAGDTGEVSDHNVFVDDIAVDSRGRVYALGFFTNVVEVFNSEGNATTSLDFSSDVPIVNDQPANAFRIAIDKYDGLYVGFFDGTIRKYDTDGNFITQLTSRGSRDGEAVFPTGIAFNEESNYVYVVDHGNYRVQVFGKQSDGEIQVPSSTQPDFGLLWILLVGGIAGIAIGIVAKGRKS